MSRRQAVKVPLSPSQGGSGVSFTTVPPGVVFPYCGSTAPTGFLLCDGAEISRTTYQRLFDAIGTAYGVGNGSTTFNIPDLRGRVPLGLDNMGSDAGRITSASVGGTNADTLGGTGGDEKHTLTEGETPAHNHAQRADGPAGAGFRIITSGTAFAGATNNVTANTTANTGGGGAHSNTQPWQTFTFIIRT